jgi:hypothetical protein
LPFSNNKNKGFKMAKQKELPKKAASDGLQLKDVGNILQMRRAIDPSHRATNAIRARFHVADLIPVRYVLNFKALNKKESAVKYNFSAAFEEYQGICDNYGLNSDYAGIRLWMTDDTTITENFSNEYGANAIQSTISSFGGVGQQIRDFAKATGTEMGAAAKSVADKAVASTASVIGSLAGSVSGVEDNLAKGIEQTVAGIMGTAAEMIIDGKAVSLPKVWKNSTYNPATSFTVKLVSPYGSPAAVNRYILEPLLYILILTAPRSSDGLSYGLPRPVRVRAYGLSNINLGMIQNVSLNRGGGAAVFNQYKQPLTLDVVLTIAPLTDGFAAMEPGMDDLAKFSEVPVVYEDKTHSYNDYDNLGNTPAITTIGNVIQSLRPAPNDVIRYGDYEKSDDADDSESDTVTPDEEQAVQTEDEENSECAESADAIIE